jgi:hypothetical protein
LLFTVFDLIGGRHVIGQTPSGLALLFLWFMLSITSVINGFGQQRGAGRRVGLRQYLLSQMPIILPSFPSLLAAWIAELSYGEIGFWIGLVGGVVAVTMGLVIWNKLRTRTMPPEAEVVRVNPVKGTGDATN